MSVIPLLPYCYMFKMTFFYAHSSLVAESGNLGLCFTVLSEKEGTIIF